MCIPHISRSTFEAIVRHRSFDPNGVFNDEGHEGEEVVTLPLHRAIRDVARTDRFEPALAKFRVLLEIGADPNNLDGSLVPPLFAHNFFSIESKHPRRVSDTRQMLEIMKNHINGAE